jgi:hypothetical protein
MQIFESNSSQTFIFNGITLPKNFIIIKADANHLQINNAYDTKHQLLPSTHFNQIEVDGIIYPSLSGLSNVLTPVIYAKSNVTFLSGATFGTLQQVTNLGNTTNDDIVLDGGAGIQYTQDGDTLGSIVNRGYQFILNDGGIYGKSWSLDRSNLTDYRNYFLPNATGTIALTSDFSGLTSQINSLSSITTTHTNQIIVLGNSINGITGLISSGITTGITTSAPSENAVFNALALKENTSNKATDFSLINNTKFPTTQAVINGFLPKNTGFTSTIVNGLIDNQIIVNPSGTTFQQETDVANGIFPPEVQSITKLGIDQISPFISSSIDGYKARLKTSNLTTDKIFEFPNSGGTIALLSNIVSPTLQQVLDAGSDVSDSSISINSSNGLDSSSIGANAHIVSKFQTSNTALLYNGFQVNTFAGGEVNLKANLSASTIVDLTLPLNSGTVALLSDIPSGSTATLQEVTNNGNTTNNQVIINNSLLVYTDTLGLSVQPFINEISMNYTDETGMNINVIAVNDNGVKISTTTNATGIPVVLRTDNLTLERTIQFPDNDGTLALQEDLVNVEFTTNKGIANGYAPLDNNNKLPNTYINDSILGQVSYQGLYNATTNTPALPSASGNTGKYWVISVSGTQQSLSFQVGDWIISNGTTYDKVDNTDAVTTVAGRTGNIVLTPNDVGIVDASATASGIVNTTTQIFAGEKQFNNRVGIGTSGATKYFPLEVQVPSPLNIAAQFITAQYGRGVRIGTYGGEAAIYSTNSASAADGGQLMLRADGGGSNVYLGAGSELKISSGNVSIGATITSAKLSVDSTTKGFLPPRMTTTQKNAITSPAAGLVVFDTTLMKLCVYTTAWETITSS